MAKNTEHNKSPEELIDEIERSRQRLSRNLLALRDELDFPGKIRRSFRRQPAVWIAAATALGLFFTFVSRGKKKIYVDQKTGRKSKIRPIEAGFVLGVLRIAAGLLKPVIVKFAARKMGDYASGRHSPRKGF
jgi:hypothetical protein